MKKHLTILFSIAVLFFIQLISFAQQQDSLIQLYPTLGDTISRQDKEFYKLFPEFPGFEYATVYVRENKFVIFRITYIADNGEERDTTQIIPLNMLGNIRAYIHTINTEYEQKIEKISSGKTITVTTADGQTLTGNITRIDNEGLVLSIQPENRGQEGYKADADFVTVKKGQMQKVFIPGESKILPYMGWGALIGAGAGAAFGALIGFASGNNLGYLNTGEAIFALGVITGMTGGVVGLITGAGTSTNDETIEIKSDQDYDKLKTHYKNIYGLYPWIYNRSY